MSDLRIYVKDQYGSAIEGVLVKLMDDTNTTLVAQYLTGADGVAYFDPPAGDYIIRMFKSGVLFDGLLGDSNKGVQAVTAADPSSSYDVVGRIPSLPESTDSNLCRVSADLVQVNIAPAVTSVEIRQYKSWWGRIVENQLVVVDRIEVEPDDGHFEVDLVRGGEYEIRFSPFRDYWYHFTVPDQPSANLVDLIWPYAASVSVSSQSVTVSASSYQDVEVTVTLSDGSTTSSSWSSYVEATSSDDSVAEVSISDDGDLRITGVAAGTTTVTFSLSNNVRIPEPSTSSFPTISVTVN